MSRGAEQILDALVEELKDNAIDLLPVAISALQGLLQGQPPERVLGRAEREALATYAQNRLDRALDRGKGGGP
jgi:hypothetical protein